MISQMKDFFVQPVNKLGRADDIKSQHEDRPITVIKDNAQIEKRKIKEPTEKIIQDWWDIEMSNICEPALIG